MRTPCVQNKDNRDKRVELLQEYARKVSLLVSVNPSTTHSVSPPFTRSLHHSVGPSTSHYLPLSHCL